MERNKYNFTLYLIIFIIFIIILLFQYYKTKKVEEIPSIFVGEKLTNIESEWILEDKIREFMTIQDNYIQQK